MGSRARVVRAAVGRGSYNVTFFFFLQGLARDNKHIIYLFALSNAVFLVPPNLARMDLSRAADQHSAVRPYEHFCYVIVCLCMKVASQLDDPSSRQAVSSLFY